MVLARGKAIRNTPPLLLIPSRTLCVAGAAMAKRADVLTRRGSGALWVCWPAPNGCSSKGYATGAPHAQNARADVARVWAD